MTNQEKARERARQVFPCPNEDEQRRIVELERAKNLSGNEIYETFDVYLSPKFSYYGNSILGVDKHINRKLRMKKSIEK